VILLESFIFYLRDYINKETLNLFLRFLTIFTCACWMLNCIFIILDIFLIMSVYLGLSKILIAVVFVSIGNSLIDFFNNGAIS